MPTAMIARIMGIHGRVMFKYPSSLKSHASANTKRITATTGNLFCVMIDEIKGGFYFFVQPFFNAQIKHLNLFPSKTP